MLAVSSILVGNYIITSERNEIIASQEEISNMFSQQYIEQLKENTEKFSLSKYESKLKNDQSEELLYTVRNILDKETSFNIYVDSIISSEGEIPQERFLEYIDLLCFNSTNIIEPAQVEVGKIQIKFKVKEYVPTPSQYTINLRVIT